MKQEDRTEMKNFMEKEICNSFVMEREYGHILISIVAPEKDAMHERILSEMENLFPGFYSCKDRRNLTREIYDEVMDELSGSGYCRLMSSICDQIIESLETENRKIRIERTRLLDIHHEEEGQEKEDIENETDELLEMLTDNIFLVNQLKSFKKSSEETMKKMAERGDTFSGNSISMDKTTFWFQKTPDAKLEEAPIR